LQSHLLIIPVDGLSAQSATARWPKTMRALAPTDLFRVDGEWALTLAVCAIANFHLLRGILIEWTQDGIALSAVELDVLELGEYTRPPGYDARHAHEIVQVARAKVA
jgi:hypothetical protein